MAIEFFADDEGRTIVRVGCAPDFVRRWLLSVNLAKLSELATEYGLSAHRKARLAMQLERYSGYFGIVGAIDATPADSAVRRQLARLTKSTSTIATFRRVAGAGKGAMDALVRAGDVWAQDKSASELYEAAFGVLGAGDLVRNWFRVASLMMEFEKLAYAELEKRNRPTGGGYFDDGVGKEVMLFGFQLPRLYERVSGKRFTVSTDETGKKKSVGGVRFVQRAASVMGLDAKSAANVAKHVRAAKEAGLWGDTAMSKKDTRVPLE